MTVNIGAHTPDTNLLIAAGVGGGVFVIIGIMAVITVSVIIAMSSRRWRLEFHNPLSFIEAYAG